MHIVNHKQIAVCCPKALSRQLGKEISGICAKHPQVQLEMLTKVGGVKPTNFIVSLPELAGLVDIDLACLLGVGPAELFRDFQGLDASQEDTSLAAKVGGTIEAKCGGKLELSLMQEVAIGVCGEIELVALPFGFQLLLVAHQR